MPSIVRRSFRAFPATSVLKALPLCPLGCNSLTPEWPDKYLNQVLIGWLCWLIRLLVANGGVRWVGLSGPGASTPPCSWWDLQMLETVYSTSTDKTRTLLVLSVSQLSVDKHDTCSDYLTESLVAWVASSPSWLWALAMNSCGILTTWSC